MYILLRLSTVYPELFHNHQQAMNEHLEMANIDETSEQYASAKKVSDCLNTIRKLKQISHSNSVSEHRQSLKLKLLLQCCLRKWLML